jgi:hypothetical protein
MKYKGTIQIESIEKELTNPTLEIKDTYIECIFTDENGDKHSRLIKEGDEILNLFK